MISQAQVFISSLFKLNPDRNLRLDVLRGVAVLLVIGRHVALGPEQAGWLTPFAQVAHVFGWTGVDLFFVLSGFLVGGILFREIRHQQTLNAGRFVIRRAFKIWPAYLVFLGLYFAWPIFQRLFLGQGAWSTMLTQMLTLGLPHLLQLQNYCCNFTYFAHLWSLAVEEHFYLLLPGICVLLRAPVFFNGKAWPKFPWVVLGVLLVCNGLRLVNWQRPFDLLTHYTPTHLRLDSLFFGVLLAYGQHFSPRFRQLSQQWWWLWLLGGLLLISPMLFLDLYDSIFVWTIGFTFLYVGYGGVLIGILYCPPLNLPGFLQAPFHRMAQALAWVGFFSYTTYLWHFNAAYATQHIFLNPLWAFVEPTLLWSIAEIFYIACATLIGALMGRLVEAPALALRERLFPAPVASTAQ